jgi:hypothetical protein
MTDTLLSRVSTSSQGTLGRFYADGWGFRLWMLELPWKDNQQRISCIPEGLYHVSPWSSSRFPNTYILEDVEGRTGILTHSGNVAGDTMQGYKTHSLGCILTGEMVGVLWGQLAVLKSAAALNKLRRVMGRKSFDMMIRWEL